MPSDATHLKYQVRGPDDRHPAGRHRFTNELFDQRDSLWIESIGGLVQQQQIRLDHHGSSESNQLRLASGKAIHAAASDFPQAPLLEYAINPFGAFLTTELQAQGEVVDDGSRDGTEDVAEAHGAVVSRHVVNRGGGAALRTGYRLMVDSEAAIVVTLDADGQHLPAEMPNLVQPVLDGKADVAHGSRVLGHAEENHFAREMGIVFFNRLVSFITRTHVTDCSNGYRAVRTSVLPTLVLKQEQFHTSEFMIEAIKRGVPAVEVPVTVEQRLHGHSKKPAVLRYGMGFANAIVRTWLR